MEQEKLEYFRKLLLEKRERLIREALKTVGELVDNPERLPDPTDQAAFESDRGFELRIRDRERKLIKKIDQALRRIEEGSYGICEACGEDIDEKRLEARPEASLCIHCKREQERLEKLRGD